MRTFFVNPKEINNDTAIITGSEAHHIKSVLRLKPNTTIRLFDGKGKIYTCIIKTIKDEETEATIISVEESQTNKPSLHLGQAVANGKKMDLIIQKTTELGITSIQPFISQHCSRHKFDHKKEDRWHRIALEACKQSVRPTPLEIKNTTDFKTVVSTADNFNCRLIFWENEEHYLMSDINLNDNANHKELSILFLIGPEGGFSNEEIQFAIDNKFQPVTLGNLILRTETAAIATTSILQYLLGNLNT